MKRLHRVLVILVLLASTGGCDDAVRVTPSRPGDCPDARATAACTGLGQYLRTAGLLDTDGVAGGVAAIEGGLRAAPWADTFHIVVADGDNGVVILEACDPARMSVVSRTVTSGSALDVAYADRLLFVAWGKAGLGVVDVGDPASPALVAIARGAGSALDVDVGLQPMRAYVVDDAVGLMIYDVGDPAVPLVLGVENTVGAAQGVCVEGPVAYVADAALGLRIVLVESPTSPWSIRTIATAGEPRDVAVRGGYAFVADGSAGLAVVDVGSIPDAKLVAQVDDTRDLAAAVAVEGRFAYLVDRREGLLVYDVSVAETPVLVARHGSEGDATAVTVARDYAFVADGPAGLRAVDVKTPVPLPVLSQLDPTGGDAVAVGAVGSMVYAADAAMGFTVAQWQAGALVERGRLPLTDAARNVLVHEGFVYVSADGAGVKIVDVANPGAPVVIRTVPGTTGAVDVAVVDSVTFTVRGGAASPATYDLRDTGPPKSIPIGSVVVKAVDVGRSFVYFVAVQGQLMVVSPDPSSPSPVPWTGPTMGHPVDVRVREDASGHEMLFVGLQTGGTDPGNGVAYGAGVEVYTLSNPLSPASVHFIETSAGVERIAFGGDLMYVAEAADGLEVFDVSDPFRPVPVASFGSEGPIRGASIAHGAVILAAGDRGLIALPLPCE